MCAAAPGIYFTPHGSLEGYQDVTNGVSISGWAWDRDRPHARLDVEIYDDGVLVTTVAADTFRTDLREAGIGDGRHGFTYILETHIRDRKSHHIGVCIAGTDVMLRDSATGAAARPITRRDHPAPPPIPHFSMPPLQRWLYFTALRFLLRIFPRPVWRPPALLLAFVHMILDRQGRALNVTLLQALGTSQSLIARWQLHWSRAYQQQTDYLLVAQAERITPQWATRHVRFDGALPHGGAILLSVHHNAQRYAPLVFAALGYRIGTITTKACLATAPGSIDATLRLRWRLTETCATNAFGDRQFSRREAGRKGLRLLAEGGYLVVSADEYARQEPYSPLLGRVMTVPRGAAWLAQHSGKPIIPYMVIPDGLYWRLWLGEVAAPTQQGLCNALEGCIRQAPGSWQRMMAMAWMAAPPWIAGAS